MPDLGELTADQRNALRVTTAVVEDELAGTFGTESIELFP